MSLFYATDSNRELTAVPHGDAFRIWSARLTPEQFDDVIKHIHSLVADKTIFQASYLPGADWTDTPLQPIYETCGDENQAALFYGLLCWKAMQIHEKAWLCYKSEDSSRLGRGFVYWLKS